MRRLVLQGTAVVVGSASGLLAWAWPEARVALVAFGVATVLGLVWLAHRFPEPGRTQLVVAAAATLMASIALAALIPSTRVLCDCPPPAGAVWDCPCPIDHRWPLRIVATAIGAVTAGLLLLRSPQHRSSLSRVPRPAR